MTKSNLKTHLKWLLDQGPSLYPVLTPPAWESHVNQNNSVSNSVPTLNLTASQPEELSIKDSNSILEKIVKNNAGDGVDLDSDREMARLMLAPPSASKPRMLSRAKESPTSSRKPLSSATLTKSPTKLEATQTPRRKDISDPHSAHSSFRDLEEQITTPLMPKRNLDVPSSLQDIDTIDLTGEFDQITAPSEVREEFGEPRRLWTEEAATRTGPVDKRGKKRKSDEYASDLLSPRDRRRGTRSPFVSGKAIQSDLHRLSQTPRGKGSPALKYDLPPTSTKRKGLPSNKGVGESRAIPDSDDDDSVGSLFEDWFDNRKDSPQVADALLYPVLPQEMPTNTSRLRLSSMRKVPVARDSTNVPEITRPTTTKTSEAGPHSSHSILPPSSNIPRSDAGPMDKDVERFLEISADLLDRLISRLKGTIKKNSDIAYEGVMRGEHTPELVALISENKTLAARIEAVETLKTQKSAYRSCEAKSQILRDAIVKVIQQGGDPLTMPELEQQKRIKSQLKVIETDICRLILEADLFSAMDNSSLKDAQSDLERLRSSPPMSFARLQSVEPSRFGKSPMARGDSLTRSTAHPALDEANPRTSPSKQGAHSIVNRFNSVSKRGQFDYDELMMSDNETAFTRTMGSPPPPLEGIDEFDMDVFDEDMLEAAEYLHNDRALMTGKSEPSSRAVFAETSGNASRLPLTQKSQSHSSLWNQHPWSKDVRNALKDRFGLRGFRLNQLEAIDATLSGKDTFVLMPTGGGKSLCYQLPSVVSSGLTRGVTIVISPLLSLMQDQVSHLRRNKIKAYLINGETQKPERQWIMSTLSGSAAEKHIEVLYITPEMINKSQTITGCLENLNERQRLARIVIDEAHCVSQWGHDFRPDYKEIGALRARLPGVPMMALTATATENVKVDVIHNLKMEGCEIFTQSFNRPNLAYEVRPKGKNAELLESIANTISESYRNKSGIVYCLSRKTCEKVAKELRDDYDIQAEHYHAGLDADERSRIQQQWQSGKTHVIVATIAFGMGIDKPDVRFVIHHSIPKSLEGYYQETGRAGRDGRRSSCYLYFAYRDATVIESMINKNDDSSDQQKNRQLQMLRNVVRFCENKSDCRRVQILAYFNESFRRQDCNASCDNCKSDAAFELQDFSQHAATAIKMVRYFERRKERVTISYCMNIFRGSTRKFKDPEHGQAPYYGRGSDLDSGEAERLFRKLLGEQALREENVVNKGSFPAQYIKLGRRAAEFESGRCRLKLEVRISPNGMARKPGDAGRDYLPQSTNVSSPVQSVNQRRLARYRCANAAEDSDRDRDSDGFERIRIAGKKERNGRKLPGPPITQDHRFDQLDSLHKAVAEDFMVYAKVYCQDLVVQKGLRNQPFTDTILREMVMVFPRDQSEMLEIPGIDADKVHRYGDKILKLVRDTQRRYSELKKERDDVDGVVPDPNHHNVVNVSSSDEFSDFDDIMDQATELERDNSIVTSQYFSRTQHTIEDDSTDDYRPSPKAGSSKSQRRKSNNKRPPRQKTDSKPRAKASRPRSKTTNRSQGRSYQRKEPKGKQPTSQIAMMPV